MATKNKFSPTVIKNTEVLETKEYSVFILDKRNRPINEDKVQFFVGLFKKGKNFMNEFPAVVDENFIILDGQHRFEACRQLGVPFYFRWANELTIENVVDVQINAGWKTSDYLHTYVKQGNQNYIILQRFINKYKLPVSTAVMLLYKSGNNAHGLSKLGFYSGNYQVNNEQEAHIIAEFVCDFAEAGFTGAKERSFVSALAKCMRHPEYSHKRMMDKFNNFGHSILRKQVNIELYVRNLEQLYNYRQPAEGKIRFI